MQRMAAVSYDACNAQRTTDARPDTSRAQLSMVLLDLILHALDAAEVAHGLDA